MLASYFALGIGSGWMQAYTGVQLEEALRGPTGLIFDWKNIDTIQILCQLSPNLGGKLQLERSKKIKKPSMVLLLKR